MRQFKINNFSKIKKRNNTTNKRKKINIKDKIQKKIK